MPSDLEETWGNNQTINQRAKFGTAAHTELLSLLHMKHLVPTVFALGYSPENQ